MMAENGFSTKTMERFWLKPVNHDASRINVRTGMAFFIISVLLMNGVNGKDCAKVISYLCIFSKILHSD